MTALYKSGFSAWEENIPFAFDLIAAIKPPTIVELGVHYGDSYFAFCQAVRENYPTYNGTYRCYGIDMFEGDDLTGYYGPAVFDIVKGYNDLHYKPFSTIIKEPFDQALKHFGDDYIKLLHIDGSHYYTDVKHDFYTWLPKMQHDGIILLHDIKTLWERYGVWKLWKEITNSFNTCEIDNKYGLGIVCLDKDTFNIVKELPDVKKL